MFHLTSYWFTFEVHAPEAPQVRVRRTTVRDKHTHVHARTASGERQARRASVEAERASVRLTRLTRRARAVHVDDVVDADFVARVKSAYQTINGSSNILQTDAFPALHCPSRANQLCMRIGLRDVLCAQ